MNGSARGGTREWGFITLTHIFLIVILAGAVWHFMHKDERKTSFSGDTISTERLAEIAATVKEGDVVMYSTTECGPCTEAKGWLKQYDFAFKECNMSNDQSCRREFEALGAHGTPYLIVRGHHMKNGFDTREFLTVLDEPRT